jgi:hypothetical protein
MFGPASDVFENIPDNDVPEARRASLGVNPDGLGSDPRAQGYPAAPQAAVGAYAEAVGGRVEFLEPPDASPDAALRSAGITSLVAAIAFGGGLALGGAWGGVSGIMLSGSAFNIYRAQKWWGSADASEKHEAVVSALFGAIGVAAGGYTAYKAYQAKK